MEMITLTWVRYAIVKLEIHISHLSLKHHTSFESLMDGQVPAGYVKPFYLFHYNKPKQPPLAKIKPVDFRAEPTIPVRMNFATKMRNTVIKETATRKQPGDVDFKQTGRPIGKMVIGDPEVVPRQTKTSQYRYKWVREVPVISCRFTEHVMMFKKPPFTHQHKTAGVCGNYRLRRMKIDSPESPEVIPEEKEEVEFLSNVLQ